MKAKLIAATVAVGSIFALWIYFSPYWYMAGLAIAADEGDTLMLSQYVNVVTLRESVKAEFIADALDDDDMFTGIGSALGFAMADRMIDSIISPAGISKMMQSKIGERFGGKDSPGRLELALRLVGMDNVSHDGLSLVYVGTHEHYVTFQRTGLRWRLAAITTNYR